MPGNLTVEAQGSQLALRCECGTIVYRTRETALGRVGTTPFRRVPSGPRRGRAGRLDFGNGRRKGDPATVTGTSNIRTGLRAAIAIAVLAAAFVLPAQAIAANDCSNVGSDPTQAQYCSPSASVTATRATPPRTFVSTRAELEPQRQAPSRRPRAARCPSPGSTWPPCWRSRRSSPAPAWRCGASRPAGAAAGAEHMGGEKAVSPPDGAARAAPAGDLRLRRRPRRRRRPDGRRPPRQRRPRRARLRRDARRPAGCWSASATRCT